MTALNNVQYIHTSNFHAFFVCADDLCHHSCAILLTFLSSVIKYDVLV
jgi:hypothetical protein